MSTSFGDEKETIDFKSFDTAIKAVAEAEIPYTNQIIEDAIFVDNETLLAIEYIYYQKNTGSIYHNLDEVKQIETIHEEEKEESSDELSNINDQANLSRDHRRDKRGSILMDRSQLRRSDNHPSIEDDTNKNFKDPVNFIVDKESELRQTAP